MDQTIIGRSHGIRVCYTDFEEYEVTYLITAFTKKEQDNLSDDEKKTLKKLVKTLKEEAARNWKGNAKVKRLIIMPVKNIQMIRFGIFETVPE